MEKAGNRAPLNQGGEHLLAAIIPPSNISRQIDLIRERLFSDYCLVSAAALPPVIPLLFLPPGRYTLQEVQLKEKIRKAFPITTGHYREYQGNLFLAVESSGGYDYLKQELNNYLLAGAEESAGAEEKAATGEIANAQGSAGAGQVPFHCTEGFFLAAPERFSDFSKVIKKLGTPGPLHFSSYSLALLKLVSFSHPGEWWQNSHWEETAKLNCRKPSKRNTQALK
ncbi:MAG: hypothetical protein GH155_02785 [Spirochaeta sp.]|nr:hypothetical protein [Spirochaeta sp.]